MKPRKVLPAAMAGSRDPDWVGAKEPGAWEPWWDIDGLLLEAHALAPKRPRPIPLPKRKRRRR